MSTTLNERELVFLGQVWQCMKSVPDVSSFHICSCFFDPTAFLLALGPFLPYHFSTISCAQQVLTSFPFSLLQSNDLCPLLNIPLLFGFAHNMA